MNRRNLLRRPALVGAADWTGEGTVYIQHNSKVYLQYSGGTPVTVAIAAGSNNAIAMRARGRGRA
jgi:hypothetical protein